MPDHPLNEVRSVDVARAARLALASMQGDGPLISAVLAETRDEVDPTDALARLISASSAGYAAAVMDRSRFVVAALSDGEVGRAEMEQQAREASEDALLRVVTASL
ncbi:hypothetical protein G6009_05505 [Dietzia sp. SLG510A3-30A2]|nr:hypothetical protein [Dietzia sp. SLG510A3-30A2]